MKKHIITCALSWCLTTAASIIVEGNDPNAPFGFLTPITAQTYDQLRGTFYVGLASGSNTENRFSLSKALRPSFTTTPSFSPVLGTESNLRNKYIEFLAFSQQTNIPVLVTAILNNNTPFEAQSLFALYNNGTFETESTDGTVTTLNDAAGSTTSGIVNIEANSTHAFAAVRPNGGGRFGDTDSGIALLNIETGNELLNLSIKNATTGLAGNLAQRLDKTSEVLKGDQGGADVIFTTSTVPPLFWDTVFNRLYVGVDVQTGGAGVNDIAKSITLGRFAGNALVFGAITPDSAIDPTMTNQIIAAREVVTDLTARVIRIMHNTTGPDYLIINGGNGSITTVSNRVQALPLVNNPADATTHGTIAKKDAPLTNFVFTVPATTPLDLPTSNEAPALVGMGPLPMDPSVQVSDMVVIDDAVYVSIGQAASYSGPVTADTGLFYSQAIFDNDGRIGRWTPWTKRVVPYNAFGSTVLGTGSTHNGPISFFEVDAKNGTVWITDGETNQVVGVTNWGSQNIPNSLPNRTQLSLESGSYSALDLDQATRGFLHETVHRYALFGGSNKVAIARISQAVDINNLLSPQMVVNDFSTPQNFIDTFLPEQSGCVQTLEYSRTSTADGNNLNFFFAGTEKGLFAFASSNGDGFNSSDLGLLNAPPFSTNSWQQIAAIQGSVIDIKTSGAGSHTLYVLVSAPTEKQPLAATLFAIPMTSSLSTMFAPANIRVLAQTGVGVFSPVVHYYGIQIIATNIPASQPENKEQLILATNQGLFRSFANQIGTNGMTDAVDQTAAAWQRVPGTEITPFFGIAGMDTPVRQTVWPFSLVDKAGCLTFEQGTIHQTSGNGNGTGTAPVFNLTFVPAQFNAKPLTAGFVTLDPISFFYSDGGRRFFIFNNLQLPPSKNKIGVIPFTASAWALAQPELLSIGSLSTIDRFFWIKLIGASGYLMAGTNSGVTALD